MLQHGERCDRVVQKLRIVLRVLDYRNECRHWNLRRRLVDDDSAVVGRQSTCNLEQVKVFQHLQ